MNLSPADNEGKEPLKKNFCYQTTESLRAEEKETGPQPRNYASIRG